MINCHLCDKELISEKALKAHVWRIHTSEGINYSKTKAGRQSKPSHRKGLTKETSEEIRRTGEKISKTMKEKVKNGTYVPIPWTEERRKALSISQSISNRGGKCKWYEYKGYKIQGTWELNVVKKLDEMNIKWHKPRVNSEVWHYTIQGKMKSYTPDLYLEETDTYLEIKGYWWGTDKEKINAIIEQHSDKKIIIIEKKEYLKILQGELVW
jgi:hypothetical protein